MNRHAHRITWRDLITVLTGGLILAPIALLHRALGVKP